MELKHILSGSAALILLAGPVLADEARWRDCRTCHAVVAPDRDMVVRGGRSGPNLWGIANRQLAGDPDFRFYSTDLRAAGATGAVWSEANFVAYLTDPDGFLRSVTGNPEAESGMHVALRSGAAELFEWLQDISE